MVASFISTKRTGGPKVQKRSGTIIAIEEESDIPCNVRRQKTGQRATLYILVKVTSLDHLLRGTGQRAQKTNPPNVTPLLGESKF